MVLTTAITPECAFSMSSKIHTAWTALCLMATAFVAPFPLDAQQDGDENDRRGPMASVARITTAPPIIDGRLVE